MINCYTLSFSYQQYDHLIVYSSSFVVTSSSNTWIIYIIQVSIFLYCFFSTMREIVGCQYEHFFLLVNVNVIVICKCLCVCRQCSTMIDPF